MITTTVIWSLDNDEFGPSGAQRNELDSYAESLSPDIPSIRSSLESLDGTELIVTRSWPTHELAQAWVDHIMKTYDPISAVVNSTPD
jgi:hypothetical protein